MHNSLHSKYQVYLSGTGLFVGFGKEERGFFSPDGGDSGGESAVVGHFSPS